MFVFVYSSCHLNIQKLKHEYPKNLNTPKKPYLNQATPQNYLPNFPTQTNPGIENFTQNNPLIIPVTWSPEYPPPPPPHSPRWGFTPINFFFWAVKLFSVVERNQFINNDKYKFKIDIMRLYYIPNLYDL